jgi:hypothetical protein
MSLTNTLVYYVAKLFKAVKSLYRAGTWSVVPVKDFYPCASKASAYLEWTPSNLTNRIGILWPVL